MAVAFDSEGSSADGSRKSARRHVDFVKTSTMRALRDTAGMSDPERTVFWMERVGTAVYRGRGDTLGAAVQRAAADLGAPVSKAKRCWDRWKEMKSVAGDVMIPFMLAYEDLCQQIETAADEFRDQRLQLRNQSHEADAGDPSMDRREDRARL